MFTRFRKLFLSGLLLALVSSAAANNTVPVINNVRLKPDWRHHKLEIVYDLWDNEEKKAKVWIQISPRNGEPFQALETGLSGDVGLVTRGRNKKIIIRNFLYNETDARGLQVKLVADDLYVVQIEELLSQVNTDSIKANVEAITGERNFRTEKGRAHLQEVRRHIQRFFNNYTPEMWLQDTVVKAKQITNIIGTQKGVENDTSEYLLCAHYDAVLGSPGADDNASGIAGLLEICRILAKYSADNTIRYVAFDMEEENAMGSQLYVDLLPKTQLGRIKGAINYDMIGYHSKEKSSQQVPDLYHEKYPVEYAQVAKNDFRGDFILVVSNGYSEFLSKWFRSQQEKYVKDLIVMELVARETEDKQEAIGALSQSDHASFWSKKIPAVHIGDGAKTRNPFYHTTGDKTAILNYQFITQVVKVTIASLATLLKVSHKVCAVKSL